MGSGTTCTVAYVRGAHNEVILAHVGDSRAVLGKRDSSMDLTRDHKPNLPSEKERIEAAGGRVVFDGYNNHRTYSWDGKGGLNMSRALGDELAREAGVTERPEIKILKLEEDDDFLLLCSDGVWEFVSRDAACSVV